MDQKGIDRINELARKAKTQELTPEEKKEQHKLRKEFIASVRMNQGIHSKCKAESEGTVR